MNFLKWLKIAFFVCTPLLSSGQQKYWISFENAKDSTIHALLPEPIICSQWLKQCSYALTATTRSQLTQYGLVLQPVLQFEPLHIGQSPNYSQALEQVHAEVFDSLGLNGSGIRIGIIDGGFLEADQSPHLRHLFTNNLVKGYRDYVTPEALPYSGSKYLDDQHGTDVWEAIAGYDSIDNQHLGMATGAQYYLARTDHGGYEKRQEEDFMIAALEWMQQQGVMLVNISLGYNKGFTDPTENYEVLQMDGRTTAVARALDVAALKHGMLIVVAAGNEARDSDWQVLSSPGDARYALTVGASKWRVWDKANYSSIGPEFIDFIKPDVVVYSDQGTSFTAPIITGLAACLWQRYPKSSNLDLINAFQQAGNFYAFPNNYVGYGVPSSQRLIQFMDGQPVPDARSVTSSKDQYVYRPMSGQHLLVLFHKKDWRNVMYREVIRVLGRKVKITRPQGVVRTTILDQQEVIEIIWK